MSPVPRRVATLLAATAMLSGCALIATGDPSTVATVGDRSVPVERVESTVDGIYGSQAYLQSGQPPGDPAVREQVVTQFVVSAIVAEIAERNDVDVSSQELAELREGFVEQAGGQEAFDQTLEQQGLSEDFVRQQIRDTALQSALVEQLPEGVDLITFVREELTDLPVEVNPRFGQWDDETLSVGPYRPFADAPPAGALTAPGAAGDPASGGGGDGSGAGDGSTGGGADGGDGSGDR